jgi:hypothetical protein
VIFSVLRFENRAAKSSVAGFNSFHPQIRNSPVSADVDSRRIGLPVDALFTEVTIRRERTGRKSVEGTVEADVRRAMSG